MARGASCKECKVIAEGAVIEKCKLCKLDLRLKWSGAGRKYFISFESYDWFRSLVHLAQLSFDRSESDAI
jgi:hypothetical protein